ncbi:hypothetical protein [Pontibacter ramchanderi]|uniref:Uncharacterized protein n=1 Tax=Pontibacter ramchanderi TaxID=1179743 RepID=A0A2N3V132_9BACT|nr:hypothetical protein [Pontibacter ramchanderi]PKV75296.1 hypothetical protein BD749_0234 [Pontibacter ramchanderi]
MTWNEARNLIENSIVEEIKLDYNSQYRKVVRAQGFLCNRYDYNGSPGYKVQIGKRSFIEIPFTMLQNVFEEAVSADGVYNKNIFRIHYPTRAERKVGHPCHVHVVGKIFEKAGVALPIDSKNYRIVDKKKPR